MKYFAVAVPDDEATSFTYAMSFMPSMKVKEVVIDDIDEDTFETVEVLT